MMTAIAVSGPAETSWRDGKKYLWPLGLLVPAIPWIAWGLAAATGLEIAWFAGPILVFGVFPFFDWAVGKDSDNPPDSVLAFLESQRYYRWCTYLTMIVLAYAPPLWRKVMDPKVLSHFDGDVRLANLQPRKREKLIAKYGTRA